MSGKLLESLRASLPNTPDEILCTWLLPYAESEGWPPEGDPQLLPLKRWRYLLWPRPLAYWQSLSWEKVTRRLPLGALDPTSRRTMLGMVQAALGNIDNDYSRSLPRVKEGFASVARHLSKHGQLPTAPALRVETGGLAVVDGNHRLAAYFFACGYFVQYDPDTQLMLATNEEQPLWIARSDGMEGDLDVERRS